jgi:hypothetical protein
MSVMNCKTIIVASVKVLHVHLSKGSEEDGKLSGQRVSGPKFESCTFQIRSRIVRSSAAVFGVLRCKDKAVCFTKTSLARYQPSRCH